MAEDLGYTTTAPSTNGDKLLPKRAGVRTMLPSAWTDKTIRLEYIGAATDAWEISAPSSTGHRWGYSSTSRGAKTLLAWGASRPRGTCKKTAETERSNYVQHRCST